VLARILTFPSEISKGAGRTMPAHPVAPAMLLAITAVKLLAEIALLALVGRWLLGLLAGAKREGNVFYQVLSIVTRPVERMTRLLSPRVVLDRHIPLAAALLLLSVWVGSTLMKIQYCVEIGVQQCR
jgi:hypothetical protein